MALDLEEQEQLDALKTWWKVYGKLIQVVLTVALLGLAGYKAYTWYQHKQSTEASGKYEALRQMNTKDIKAVQAAAGELIDHYASTPYAGRAALLVAKINYASKDAESARAQLEWAAKHAKEDQVQALATLQLAGLQYDQKKYDEALKTLEAKHDEGFDGLYADLRGDILVAQGKPADAKKAYEEALAKLDEQGRYRHYTEHKLEALGS